MSLEIKLISALVDDPEAIAKVWRVGLCAEVFEEPLSRYVYEFVIDYWLDSGKKTAPTAYAIETERPGFKVLADVEEEAWWLAERLRKRSATNNVQEMVRKAAKTCHSDPIATVHKLAEDSAQARKLAGTGGGPRIWDADDLKPPEQPRWLAKNRLPRAALTMLLGDEGIGKSLFCGVVATHVSTGKAFEGFGMPVREPGAVVLVLTEDDWSTDVLPRLKVLGADLSMVKVFCTADDGSGSPEFPRDIHLIEAMDPSPVLVVVDCWMDTLPQGKKVSDPQQARSVLHPWRELATRTDAAVMLSGHTNRIASANPREKYGGTYALRQKARMTLFAQQDQDGHLVVGPEKANGTAILPASIFTIDTEQFWAPTPEHDGKVPFLKYEGESDKTARQHLEENFAADQDTDGKADATLWLALLLAEGPRWSSDVHHLRKLAKISKKKLDTAKTKLNVKSVFVPKETKGEGSGAWFMRLPKDGDLVPEGPPEFPPSSSTQEGDS